jgi:CDP-diacylglycerol---serine O-phosphatidyltransferase
MIKRNIPNFITCLNLFSGCLAVVAVANDEIIAGCFLIVAAVIFDFLDGLAARVLRVSSEIGKQLDSLADAVSFGVAPGFILFQMITIGFNAHAIPLMQRPTEVIALASLGFLVAIFGVIRLARFNLDTKQTEHFIGLAIPASALLIISFIPVLELGYSLNLYAPPSAYIYQYLQEEFYFSKTDVQITSLLFNPYFYITLSIVLSLLMVSRFHMFSMKIKKLKSADNIPRLLIILIGAFLIYEYELLGVPLLLISYIILAIVYGIIKNFNTGNNTLKNEIQS